MPVAPGTPPTAVFTTSPTSPRGVNQDVFFNASARRRRQLGRTITRYEWSFGDGEFAQGVIVTHGTRPAASYAGAADRPPTMPDDRSMPAAVAVTVGPSLGPTPTATVTFSPAVPKPGPARSSATPAAARPGNGSNIESYTFNWGDGSPEEVQTNPLQTHAYAAAGTFVVTVTVRDTLGRTAVGADDRHHTVR